MTYGAGEFCWVDVMARDGEAATKFYCELFGWSAFTTGAEDGHPYTMLSLPSGVVAGLGEMSDEMKAAGVPVVWNTYICVDDVEATCERAKGLGAEIVFPPQAAGDQGWLAYLKEPGGAMFAIWQAADGSTPSLRGVANSCCWNELNTSDRDKSEGFYGELFNWAFETKEVAPGAHYTTIHAGGKDVGGMMQMDERWEGAPPHWVVYFACDDVDAKYKQVIELGGKGCLAPTDFPAGRFATAFDPQGGMFALIKMNH